MTTTTDQKARWRERLWWVGLWLMGLAFATAGVLHFTNPAPFVAIIPPWLPSPLTLVYLSGVAEIGLGLGVLVPKTRRLAAWGLVALLIAVFPANIYHAVADVPMGGSTMPLAYHIVRLPMQLVLIAWAWLYTRPFPNHRAAPPGSTPRAWT